MLQKKSVDQILNLLTHVKKMNKAGSTVKTAYQEAVDRVRKEYNVAYQTIGDLCCRRQGLGSVDVFVNMLEEWLVVGNPEKLKQLLLSNSDTAYRNEITQFFNNEMQGINSEQFASSKCIIEEYENFNVKLHKEHIKKLKVLTVMNEQSIHEKLTGYLENRIDEEYNKWLQKETTSMSEGINEKKH